MPPYPLTNFEIEKYYQHKPTFNGVYSRNNLPKIKHGAYIINLDEYEYHIFVIKHYFFLIFVTGVGVKMNKYLWKNDH